MKSGYIYITANEKEWVLYIGVTSDLPKRIWEHKNTVDPTCFTAQYNCKKLVYYEIFDTITPAIEREKQLKNWHRDWKIWLINSVNPNWDDLYNTLVWYKRKIPNQVRDDNISYNTLMPPFLEQNKDLLRYSSFHTPATARYFFALREKEDIGKLHDIWKFAQENSLPIVFLGSGTNVLFAFDMFEGIIVRNTLKWIQWSPETVRVAGGELISPLSLQVSKTRENSLFGKWVWLPGSVGGAVAGNAGCFGFEVKDTLLSATVFDMKTDEYRTIQRSEMDFSYRHSILKETPHWFLVDAVFRTDLTSDDATDPRTFRSGKQPGGFTCGSFFRNPPWHSAGQLIDQAGLKGHRIGGVKISEMHANFFVNNEKGSYRDILALRDLAKKRVREMSRVELKEEVRIIG